MLNTALPVLYKDGTIADNTYQIIAEDSVIPRGDVVLTTAQLDQLANIQGKKALYVTVNDSPEDHTFPLSELDAILSSSQVSEMGEVIHSLHYYVAKVSKVNYVQQVMYLRMS